MPWPAWEYFDVNTMLDNGIGNTSFGKDSFRPFPLNATRGCPYECTFCSNPQMWGRLWRTRPAEDVIAEMKFLMERYKANHFDFTDLTLAVKKSWLINFGLLNKYKKFLIYKGSISINGVSFTISKILKNGFQISIVPHTLKLTNLVDLKVRDPVNIEFDIIGKYIKNFNKR